MKNLNEFGVQEMNTKEVKEIDGGRADAGDVALAACATAGLVMVGIGLIATGPVGVAVGIMGGSMGMGSTVAGIVKGFFG